MGRAVRRVPANWQHPTDENGNYVDLEKNYIKRAAEWTQGAAKWDEGLVGGYKDEWLPIASEVRDKRIKTYEDWDGPKPNPDDYMPVWTEAEATHYMMYQNVSEGTPISPACKTPEALAHWLADHGANACAGMTATYDQWLAMVHDGNAPSMVYTPETGLISGVAATTLPARR